jgi:predicted branched-subunit amino acid permease
MKEETAGVTASKNNPALLALERDAFKDGWRQMSGIAPAVIAWGVVAGMAMVKAGLTVWEALGMTLFVYSGTTQLAALPLLLAQVPVPLIFLMSLVINSRYIIFSALMAPHMAHMKLRDRLIQNYLITDVPMALFGGRFAPHTLGQHAGKWGFSYGVCICCWVVWQIGSIFGILFASQIPEHWQIGFTGSMALIALLIPLIANRSALVGVVVSSGVAIWGYGLPYRLGLLLGTIAGVAAAVSTDKLIKKTKGLK